MSHTIDFNLELAKAEQSADGKLILEGVASTTDLDAHKERMSESALADMAKAIGIPLTDSHKAELGNVIGEVIESRIEDGKLVIKAEIDNDDPAAVRLFKKVKNNRIKAGFSVGGKIVSDKPSAERGVRRIITGVALDHIMLTAKPANAKTFATALTKALEDLDAEDLAREIPPQDDQTTQGDLSMEIQDDLAKAGAKFSAESKAALKEIHDAGNDDVKAKVRAMLGDEADELLADAKDTAGDNDGDVTAGDTDTTGGVINKDDAQKPELSKEQLAELRTEIVNELRESVKELFKTAPDLKGAQGGTTDEPDAYATAVGAMLGKAIRF